jgi:hypothetical protein
VGGSDGVVELWSCGVVEWWSGGVKELFISLKYLKK